MHTYFVNIILCLLSRKTNIYFYILPLAYIPLTRLASLKPGRMPPENALISSEVFLYVSLVTRQTCLPRVSGQPSLTLFCFNEKTCFQGFRPGQTQSDLYSHRRWLEAFSLGFRRQRDCTTYEAKTKALISCAVLRS